MMTNNNVPDTTGWEIPKNLDTTDFDFTWRPNPYDPPFIHQFGTQWQKTGGPRYVVEGATQIKYEDSQKAKALPKSKNKRWRNIDNLDFDTSWHPDDTEPEPYIYQFNSPTWRDVPGPRYVMPGAKSVKYVTDVIVRAIPDWDKWEIPNNIDKSSFDFSWAPSSYEPEPYIYQFGTQWQKQGGPRYVVPDATSIKHVDDQKATVVVTEISRRWRGNLNVNFDFSWHPDETSPPYIYQFGTKWNKSAGPRYVIPGATDVIYVNDILATLDSNGQEIYKHQSNWILTENIDDSEFDYMWSPPDTDTEPYIYQFGTQWQKTGGPRYVVEGATQVKYEDSQKVIKLSSSDNWFKASKYEILEFDYSWHPDDSEEPCVYAFGNQHPKIEETPSMLYLTSNATSVKYCNDQVAIVNNKPLDIFFIGNEDAETNDRYDWLVKCANRDIKRVSEVTDQKAALVKAAELSDTDWFFVYPTKLRASEDFNFNFQPDRLQESKHYVFYAKNPVNQLTYGHMSAVCYNKQLVLSASDSESDTNLSQSHELVPIISGIAEYNTDHLATWQIAFTEVIRLKTAGDNGDQESNDRLFVWLTIAEGNNAQWSLDGAKDGLNYYMQVNGDSNELTKTSSLDWLNEHYKTLYE